MTVIQDGTGTGNNASVDTAHRLQTKALATPIEIHALLEHENLLTITSGVKTLTTDGQSAILVFQNNEEEEFVILNTFYDIGHTTGGSDIDGVDIGVHINATGGTLLSETVGGPGNNHFGSSKTFDMDVQTGGEGFTLTGGLEFGAFQPVMPVKTTLAIPQTLPKGASFGFSITPPAGNTNMKFRVALMGYYNIKE